MLTEAQVVALEKAKTEKEAHGEFESEHPGYCGAQDTFYVGNLKGVGRVYQQTFIDTYAKVACAKLYDRKTPITAADLLNDRVIPFFDSHDVKLLLTTCWRPSCGRAELGQHLARDAVDAHAGPLGALAVARIGGLPKQGDHTQFLQQNRIEGHLIQPVENL